MIDKIFTYSLLYLCTAVLLMMFGMTVSLGAYTMEHVITDTTVFTVSVALTELIYRILKWGFGV